MIPRLRSPSIPFSKTKDGTTVHVLQHPPGAIPILWKRKWKDDSRHKRVSIMRFKIKTPWINFLVRMNGAGAITDTFLFFSRSKAEDLEEPIFLPPLPNIYPSGHICNGTIRVMFNDPPWLKVTEAFRAFWTTPFTEETWPEDDVIVPKCWQDRDLYRYYIEYGYLVYIFEYWQAHDKDKEHADCFPWKQFRVRSKDKEKYIGTIKTLGQAIDYALAFPNYKFP